MAKRATALATFAFAAYIAAFPLPFAPVASQQLSTADDRAKPIEIRAQAIVAFDANEPARKQFGALAFRGGLILESPDREFGGVSGFRIMPGGERFLAVTDRGNWLRGRIVYRNQIPIGIADAAMASMLGPDGRALNRRRWYDAEGLAVEDGIAYVGFERVNQIVRFDIAKDDLSALGRPMVVSPGIKLLPPTQGIECLEMAPKGSALAGTLIAISERGLDTHRNLKGFLSGKTAGLFSLKRTDDFDVTDCAALPDGRLLVLERRFSWTAGLAIRIRAASMATIKPGALVDGEEVFFADMRYEIDNMEALSVHLAADGALVLTLVSDDNFSALQRTLLLQFTLVKGAVAPERR